MALSCYYAPTRVTFGEGAALEAGRELKRSGAEKVLVHYGSERIRKTGLLSQVIGSIEAEGIAHVELGGVQPNPRLGLCREGKALCEKEGVDFILAIGGGSVVDSAKCIAYALGYEGDVWDFFSRKAVPQKAMPIGVVLTMAAAGSEMSDSCVITNEEGWLKRGCNSDLSRAKFALLDPALTTTLPPFQTAAATVDIMMHTIERYFTPGGSLGLTDQLSFALLRTVKEAGAKALTNPNDLKSRGDLMWASSLSHNGLMALGNTTRGDWGCHQLEHELSGMFDVAHGAGLAAILPTWLREAAKTGAGRVADLGRNVFGIENADDAAASEETAKAFEDYFSSLGMPVRISGLGIKLTEEQVKELALKCSFEGTRKIGAFMCLDEEGMAEIYRKAK